MTANELILLITIGVTAGFVAGMMGVGGAIILVPALVFFFGMTQHQAQGTSLVVLLFPVGILAVMNYYKRGFVNTKFALIIILSFVLGSYVGSLLAVHIPSQTVKRIFGILLLVIGARMVLMKN